MVLCLSFFDLLSLTQNFSFTVFIFVFPTCVIYPFSVYLVLYIFKYSNSR